MLRVPNFASGLCTLALLGGVPVCAATNAPVIYYQSAPSWLENQIVIGELKKDEELVLSAVERWLAIEPTNSEALFAKGRWLVRNDQFDLATSLLAKVKMLDNKDIIRAFESYLIVNGEKKSDFNQILLLQKGGQNAAALTRFNALFDSGRPDITYELEYLDLLSTFPEHADETLKGYQALDTAFPHVGEIQIRLARHLARYYDEKKAIEIYKNLANDAQLGAFASSLWLNELDSQPLSQQWFDTYSLVASYHPDDLSIQQKYETATSRWSTEKNLRKDPRYRAKRRSLAEIRQGNYTASGFKALRVANKTWPNDPDILDALSRHEFQRGNYVAALAYLKQAKASDDNPDLADFYSSQKRSIEYWQSIDLARQSMVNQNLNQAEIYINKALEIDGQIALAYVFKGQILRGKGDLEQANQWAQKAIALEPLSTSALELWVETYQPTLGAEGQMLAINTLTSPQRKALQSFSASVEHTVILNRLKEVNSLSPSLEQSPLFQDVIASTAYLPWLKKDIAEQLLRLEERDLADYMMRHAYIEHQDAQHTHAFSLFLVSENRWTEAYGIVSENKLTTLTPSEQATFTRITLEYHRQTLQKKSANEQEISPYIDRVAEQNLPIAIVLWSEFGYQDVANEALASVDVSAMQDYELVLYSQVTFDLNQGELHHAVYTQARKRKMNVSVIDDRELAFKADQYLANKQPDRAAELYVELINSGFNLGTDRYLSLVSQSPDHAEQLINASADRVRLLTKEQFITAEIAAIRTSNQAYVNFFNNHSTQQTFTAFDYWRLQEEANAMNDRALVQRYAEKSLLLDDKERHELTSTRSMRAAYRNADDQWMTNDLISTLDVLRERNQSYVMFGAEFNSVPNGATFLTAPVELSIAMPDWDGHLKLRTESVYLNSGELTYYNEGVNFERSRVGQAFSVGWQASQWRADIGTTPIGFRISDWVGGVEGTSTFGDVSMRASISKRPVTSSLISYSGLEVADRRGNVTEFGGITRAGGTVSASWNDGRPYGFWGYGEYHKLTGKNVADNDRLSGMFGGYYNLISSNDQALSIGSSLFYMGYDKNVNEVVVGHGNYYSPQSYVSVSLPVSYYRRYNYDWTYGARGTVSLSNASFDAPYLLGGSATTSSGVSSAVQLYTEYKMTDHWSLVGYLSQQFSSDYQPSLFNLYFKYHFDPAWESAELQPDPLRLYSSYY
ncbi:cellulose synthase subunit BcsC-related outer membrane protein [Vibrio methylphosphonaticus]|uniref:cellulose synthase subunit BcsC-related outer membrane protein n=1 Tax=Vibrio methylphosphonaticus TaxID=2946866 RepID=UPI002029F711|nr:cellulose synthase subunit BcsC-related outer membrane protein [Vibrio methylphosphonaticus]MCL9773968.1 cellulose synthase subunit BcsC-related outer membrane protein [Vibrio methylphosphonaticus]